MRGKKLVSISFIIITITLLSRILGFVREETIAYFFGTTFVSDAMKIATYIPFTISHLLVAGILSAVFIPVFTDFLVEKKEDEMWEVFNTLFNTIVIIFLILSVIFFIFSRQVVYIMAPHASEDMLKLATLMFKILIPQMLILGIATLFTGLHNTYESFTIPAIGGFLYNFSVVILLIIGVPLFGPMAIVYGALFGSIAQLLIQLPFVIKKGWRYKFILNLKNPYVKKIGLLSIPILINSTFAYITPIFEKSIGSSFGEGAISSLDYAYKVSQLPLGLFALAIALVIYPTLSQLVARKEIDRLGRTLNFGLRFILYLMLPSALGLILLSFPIIRLLFQQGEFTVNSSKTVSMLLSFYSIGLPFWGMTALLNRAFYSFKDTTTPVIISLITIFIQISLYFINSRILGLKGIPLAASIAAIVQFVLLYIFIKKKVTTLSILDFIKRFLYILIYSVIMSSLALYASNYFEKNGFTLTKKGQIIQVFSAIVISILVYFVLIYIRDYKDLKKELKNIRGGIDRNE